MTEANKPTEASEPSKPTEPPQAHPTSKETWVRLLLVLKFLVIYGVAAVVLLMVIVVQFGFIFITRERNPKLLTFSGKLNRYIFQIQQFVAFNSNHKPFPFSEWPGDDGAR